jgi:putative (di)nucleoside polyphosphate hydrolase
MEFKPYRPNVGIALFNAAGRVFIAKRFKDDGPEVVYPGLEWQMPQGGIDPNEDPRPAAVRELFEETGVTSVEYLGETPGWMTYEFPPYDGPAHRLGVFRGQRQKWFAFRHTGPEAEIVVTEWRNGQEPEFDAWRWEPLENVPNVVVPFRRDIYLNVAKEFARFAVPPSPTARRP